LGTAIQEVVMSERPKFTSHEEYIASMPSDVQKEKHCMSRRLISSGSQFESEIGYSRAVVDGNWVFVSGTTGFDYQTMTIAEGLSEQTEQCLRNIQTALTEAGATLADVVRVTYVLPKADEFRECWPVLRRYFGEIRPAAMMISAGLADPRMRIEIEVTARIGSGTQAEQSNAADSRENRAV
jgi:enamine deaminase RidA (YjgF/YER057c/UK114 family)